MAYTIFSLPDNPPIVTKYNVVDLSEFDPAAGTLNTPRVMSYDMVISAFVKNCEITTLPTDASLPQSWTSTDNNRAFFAVTGLAVTHLVRLRHISGNRFALVASIPGETGFEPDLIEQNSTHRLTHLLPPNIPSYNFTDERWAEITAKIGDKVTVLEQALRDVTVAGSRSPEQIRREVEDYAYHLFAMSLTEGEKETERQRIFKVNGVVQYVNHLFAALRCWGVAVPTPLHWISIRRPASSSSIESRLPYIQIPIDISTQLYPQVWWDASALQRFNIPVVTKAVATIAGLELENQPDEGIVTGPAESYANALIYGRRAEDQETAQLPPAIALEMGHNLELFMRDFVTAPRPKTPQIDADPSARRHADQINTEVLKQKVKSILARRSGGGK